MKNPDFTILALTEGDLEWVKQTTKQSWGDVFVVVHGDIFHPWKLPGFVVRSRSQAILGLVTFQICGDTCEIITLNSFQEDQGVGSALVGRTGEEALRRGCRWLRVTTTNDNQRAIDFYLRRGFLLKNVHPGAVERSREIKPAIPAVSPSGVPITDEWEFELDLTRTK